MEEFHSRLLVFEHCLQQQDKEEKKLVYQANLTKIEALYVSECTDGIKNEIKILTIEDEEETKLEDMEEEFNTSFVARMVT